jgi:hypothetical protein
VLHEDAPEAPKQQSSQKAASEVDGWPSGTQEPLPEPELVALSLCLPASVDPDRVPLSLCAPASVVTGDELLEQCADARPATNANGRK